MSSTRKHTHKHTHIHSVRTPETKNNQCNEALCSGEWLLLSVFLFVGLNIHICTSLTKQTDKKKAHAARHGANHSCKKCKLGRGKSHKQSRRLLPGSVHGMHAPVILNIHHSAAQQQQKAAPNL